MTPEQLGPYRLGKRLGRGGMGTVYQGTNVENGRQVAVKVLAPALTGDDAFRHRFAAEIETLQRLRHPNIVQLLGFGEQGGMVYYAMELVVGRSLEEELQQGRRFTWREVTRIGVEICKALKHAHDHGVVHRDLKPANLLIDEQDRVKLSDFGIAKLFGSTSMTGDGGVLGTADYMAPEQAEGRGANARSDLYSLGCVLYALLAGEPPFRGRSLAEVLHKLRYEKPLPVSRRGPDIPKALDTIVGQLLEKEPEKRFRSAAAVARALQAMEHALSIAPQEKPKPASEEEDFLLGQGTPGAPLTRVPAPEGEGLQERDAIAKAPTRVAPATVAPEPVPKEPAKGAPPESGATSLHAPSVTSRSALSPPSKKPVAPSADHFTAVDPAGPRHKVFADAEEPPPPWGQIAAGAAALIAIALAGWFALQPPSPETLRERIVAAADNPATLAARDSDIEQFLALYPSDEWAATIRAYQQEVQLYRLERKLTLQATRRIRSKDPLAPVVQAYLEAIEMRTNRPEEAADRLEALVTLYEDDRETTTTRDVLELARRQLETLRPIVETVRTTGLAELTRQLKRADELAKTAPDKAQLQWRAIIELYQDKPWAAEGVAEARAKLKAMPAGE